MAGVFDETTPAGTEAISNGDDRIRELKTAIKNFLLAQGVTGAEAVFPGSAPTTAPVYRPRFAKGATAARPAASADQGIYVNDTLKTIQRCNDASWDDIATLIPSGTVMVFYQASAPTGWTAVAANDKFLRVVTAGGTGGTTGGTMAASTSLAHTHTVAAHTHDLGNHTHSGTTDFEGANRSDFAVTGAVLAATHHQHAFNTSTPSTNTSGSASPATDSQLAGAFAYADVIIATKD